MSQLPRKKDSLVVIQIALLIGGSILSLSGFFDGNFVVSIPGIAMLMIVIALNLISRKKENSLDILKSRLVKGEITKEEFEELKKTLQ